MPLSIEICVLYNSLAMCMDIAETYDDKCRAEKTHLGDRVEIRGL